MISKRLKSLVSYIDYKDKVIDIGCDHALLDIYLVKNGYLKDIIVSDVHKDALQSGIDNIKKEGLENKINSRLGNGLEVLTEKDLVDTILISGMGTNTILKILNNIYIKNIKKMIIQSNNDHYLLRKSICLKGYIISDESVIYDNEKYYINIVFEKGNKKYSEKDYKFGPILKDNKEYYKYLNDKYKNILSVIPENSEGRVQILEKIKELEEFI